MTSPDEPRASPSASTARPVRGWRPDDRYARPGAAQRVRRLKVMGVVALLLGLLGTIIALIYISPRSVPPVRFVGIGIGAYDHLPPNPGGRNDVVSLREHFEQLHEQFDDEFRPVLLLDDNLKAGPLLQQLKDQLADAQGETLIVYCSTLAYVSPQQDGTVELLAIHADSDSLLTGGDGGRVSIRDVLSTLSETPAGRVLVFLDVTRLEPNPRLGILARDVAAELDRDLSDERDMLLGDPQHAAGRPRMTVVCSSAPGESSWTTQDAEQATHSVFGNMLQTAIREGACDGVLPETKPDDVVSSAELIAWLKQHINDWSDRNRAVSQTITVWGDETTFDVMAVRQPQPKEPAEDAAAQSKVALVDERRDQQPGATSAQTATSAAETSAAGSRPPAEAEPVQKLTLAEGWKRRDALASQIAVVFGSAPHAWRSLNAQLIMADEQQRAGYDVAANESLRIAGDLFAKIALATKWNKVDPDPAHWQLTLGLWSRIAERAGPTPEQTQAYRMLLATLAEQAAQAPSETPPAEGALPAAPEGPLSKPEGRYLFANWVIDELIAGRGGHQQLKTISDALTQLDRSRLWPRAEWPAELLAAAECSRAAAEGESNAKAWRDLLQLTREWYAVAGRLPLRPDAVTLVHPRLDQAGRSLIGAERWLRGGAPTESKARQWLDRARDELAQTNALATEIEGLTSLELTIDAMLPDATRGVAELAELDRSRRYRPEQAAELSRLLARDTPGRADDVLQAAMDHWPVSGDDVQTRSEHELLKVMQQMHAVRDLWDELSTGDARTSDDVLPRVTTAHRELDDRWRALLRTRASQQAALRRLRGLSLDDWLEVRVTLGDPNWSADDRSELERMLTSPVERPLQAGGPTDLAPAPAGLWNGFWDVAMLQLAGLVPQELRGHWEAWEALIDEAGRRDGRVVLRRAELGEAINRAWGGLRERVSRSDDPRKQVRFVRGLHGWDTVPTMLDADDVVLQQRQEGFSQLVGVFLNWWPYRQSKPGWDALRQRGEVVTAPARRPEEPHLDELTRVECDSNRTGELPIRWSGPAQDVRIVTFADLVTFRRNGQAVRFPDTPSDAGGSLRYEVVLPTTAKRGERVTIGLTDASGFPYDLRTVEVVPPIDPSQWRIEFSTAQGGKPIRQIDFVTTDDHGERPGTRISLPPSATVQLQATLIIPATEPAQTVEFECQALPESGAPTSLIPLTRIARDDGQTRIPLMPTAPAEGAAAPPVAAAPAGVDASRGLLFRFIADGKQDRTLEYLVLPEFLLPDRYIDRPEPTLAEGTLTVPVERPPASTAPDRDWLIAAEVPVALETSPVLQAVASGAGLLGKPDLKIGESLPLTVGINREALGKWERQGRFAEFGLSVGGWPYAYRWRLENGGIRPIPDAGQSAVRFAEPTDDHLIERKPAVADADLPIRLQVFARSLDVDWESRQRWRLACALRSLGGQRIESIVDSWDMQASTVQTTTAQLSGPVWTLTTTAQPYATHLDLKQLGIGRYELIARLMRDDELQSESRTRFSIDSSGPTVEPATPPEGQRHRYDLPLTSRFSASDPESGLQSLRLGLDVNGNGQLDDDEPQQSERVNDFDGYVERLDLTAVFAAKELPQKVGTYRLVMEATNRLGMRSAPVKHFVELIAPPPSMKKADPAKPPPPPTTGKLTVSAVRILSVEIKGPMPNGPFKLKKDESRSFDDLPPGTYTVHWKAYNDSGSSSVKIEAGDAKSVAVGR